MEHSPSKKRLRPFVVFLLVGTTICLCPVGLFFLAVKCFSDLFKRDIVMIDLDPGQQFKVDGKVIPIGKLSESPQLDYWVDGSIADDGKFWTTTSFDVPEQMRLPIWGMWVTLPDNADPLVGNDLTIPVRFQGIVSEIGSEHTISQTVAVCRKITFFIDRPPKQPEMKWWTVKCSLPGFTAKLQWRKQLAEDVVAKQLVGTLSIDRKKLGVDNSAVLYVDSRNWDWALVPAGTSTVPFRRNIFEDGRLEVTAFQVLKKYPLELTGRLRRITVDFD